MNAAKERLRKQDDGLRHDVGSNMRLRGGEDPAEARRRENAAAVGGMRNPRESLLKVPGHIPVAAEVVTIIRTFLHSHPDIAPNVLQSIGICKEELEAQGFVDHLDEHVLQHLRERLAATLGADLTQDTAMTELVAPLFSGWIRRAGDPDRPLGKWLYDGAPAGIRAHPEGAGIFPPSESPPIT